MTNPLYYYQIIERHGRKTVPAAWFFDGPDDDDHWIGHVVAKDKETLTKLLNRMEGTVNLEDL